MIPYSFLLYSFLLYVTDHTEKRRLLPAAVIIFLAGFFVEVAGVNTGTLFGVYAYGKTMGPRLWGVPLVMGLTWLMMMYLTVSAVQSYSMHPVYRTVLSAVLMVMYDFLLEPVAMWLNMWNWKGGDVPMMNYIMWFLVSLVLAALFPLFRIRIRNRLAGTMLAAQLGFFLLLNLAAFIDKMLMK
jgi:putative membrane protein